MRGAVNVRVVAAVKVRGGVDHRLRLLRGGRVVEPDEGLAVDELMQRGEIAPHPIHIKTRRRTRRRWIRSRRRRGLAGGISGAQEIKIRPWSTLGNPKELLSMTIALPVLFGKVSRKISSNIKGFKLARAA